MLEMGLNCLLHIGSETIEGKSDFQMGFATITLL